MLLDAPRVSRATLERTTGWELTPRGACRGDVCVPLNGAGLNGEQVDLLAFAQAMQMPLVEDREAGLWALGPQAGGAALTSVEMPDLVLPDVRGGTFDLRSLRGTQVLLVAWATW